MKQRSVLVPIVTALVVASGVMAAPAPSPTPDMAREAVVAALAAGGDIPGQARNLAKLAWPAGKRDELVAARARLELENFGDHAMLALRDALNSVKTEYTEEVVVTTIGAQRQSRIEMSSTHLPILLDTLWVGSHAAKVRAIVALAETHSPVAVQPLIDSAIADPSLAQSVLELLGAMRYQQARFYLERVMMEGSPALRPVAASSLAQIGGAAIVPLRNALKTDSRDARLLAARAILPAANEYDIGAIYEYIEKHGDDDPGVTQALKSLAAKIEAAIAARDASAAAGSLKNF